MSQLAALSLETLLDTPVQSVLDEATVVRITRSVLGGWAQSSELLPALNEVIARAVNELSGNRKTVKSVLSPSAREALREIVSRPFSPDRALVLSLIDRAIFK